MFPNPTIRDVLLVDGLNHNLLGISKLCNKHNNVTFNSSGCKVVKLKSDQTIFTSSISGNTYMVNLNMIPSNYVCLLSKNDESWIWHKRIAHIHVDHFKKLVLKDLVIGFPNLRFEKIQLCDACQNVKQVRASFKFKNVVSTKRTYQLLHMDIFGTTRTKCFGRNIYALVVVNNYSRYTWTLLLSQKRYMFVVFRKLVRVI